MRVLFVAIVSSLAAACGAPPPHSLSAKIVDAGLCRPSAVDAGATDGGAADAGACAADDAGADHQ